LKQYLYNFLGNCCCSCNSLKWLVQRKTISRSSIKNWNRT